MKIQYVLILLFFTSTVGLQMSCKKEKVSTLDSLDCPETISFQSQIMPMLDINCSTSGCHASGAGGINLLNHAQVSANAEEVLAAIRHDPSQSPMPLGQPKLPDSIAIQLSCWINQGKQDN